MTVLRSDSKSRSAELLDVIDGYDSALVVMHDNPDPDAIASGWGLEVLLSERLRIPVRVVGGGAIVRAENRHMVDLLNPSIELVDEIEVDDTTAAILVDCGAEATNHLLTRHRIRPVAMIDHHHSGGGSHELAFTDLRPDVAASATIVASYLRQQGIEPQEKLATAMLYAIRTETCGHETHYSRLDRSILPWLTSMGEPALLAEIENAPLTREYFGDLLLALQSTFLHDGVAFCFLPRASGAEIVGEVADMLARCEEIQRVLCAAVVGDDLVISARTGPGRGSAVKLLVESIDGMGGAGGHQHRAGGKICVGDLPDAGIDAITDQLRTRWLAVGGKSTRRGTRLIAKDEIVANLHR